MRSRLLPALITFSLALSSRASVAQTALQLRWELVGDSNAAFTGDAISDTGRIVVTEN